MYLELYNYTIIQLYDYIIIYLYLYVYFVRVALSVGFPARV